MTITRFSPAVVDSRSRTGPKKPSVYWLQSRVEEYLIAKAKRLFEPAVQVGPDIDVEALRVALWQAVAGLGAASGPGTVSGSRAVSAPGAAQVATAGFWAAEAGHRVLHTAVHVHGGVGIDVEYPLHRYFLAAEYHEFLLGGATAQLLELSEVLT